ncbi:similar to hypothetical protein (predicted), isoform CRA_b [Rattus norvegicus]|uniref:Ubiquitin carboxyl-terminal hydrolase MINDY n=1 Tax=Rattus norvegicus TaxID=10116 RepID=A6K0X6_RAT|nr:similar to hypothetical protein (predicted), isoform CRA_b [Rattus norvegicus]
MDSLYVEEVAASLVREFLSRKGLNKTFMTMDQERPRCELSINSRNDLRRVLHLEFLYKENKTKEKPLKTNLELITRYFLDHFGNTDSTESQEAPIPAIPIPKKNSKLPLRYPEATLVNIYEKSQLVSDRTGDKPDALQLEDVEDELIKEDIVLFPPPSMLKLLTVSKPIDLSLAKGGPCGVLAAVQGCVLQKLLFEGDNRINSNLVRQDFDVPTSHLIGAHGYCTQELVNLLLTGRAVSNVFNDVVELDSGDGNITLLRGIEARSDIGFLSLFEHYNVCQVGCFLKTPRFPIWVVCSESHFSILFSLQPELLCDWKSERLFDLYYYDGLANQQEEIRLTVDTTKTAPEDNCSDLVPPLELCIRTKWKGASVNWNGSDPIL